MTTRDIKITQVQTVYTIRVSGEPIGLKQKRDIQFRIEQYQGIIGVDWSFNILRVTVSGNIEPLYNTIVSIIHEATDVH